MDLELQGQISRMAKRVRIEIPVGPEIRQRLRVLDVKGFSAEGARLVRLRCLRGPRLTCSAEPSDRLGQMELRRLPYAPAYEVTVAFDGHVGVALFKPGAQPERITRARHETTSNKYGFLVIFSHCVKPQPPYENDTERLLLNKAHGLRLPS